MRVFKPTGTSQALIEAVKPHIRGGKLLDLACGCGIVGRDLRHLVDKVYASDISQEAVDSVKQNCPNIKVKQGNLFEPWRDMEFDYIVDDVSGVAEGIARVSPWFDGVPCDSGEDGTDLVIDMLGDAFKYLKPKGKLFFPIVSLSGVDKILCVANLLYKTERLSHTEFPLPKEMMEHIDILRELKKEGIQFQEKFGMILFHTDIYMAKL